jgi:hypothetical protein
MSKPTNTGCNHAYALDWSDPSRVECSACGQSWWWSSEAVFNRGISKGWNPE